MIMLLQERVLPFLAPWKQDSKDEASSEYQPEFFHVLCPSIQYLSFIGPYHTFWRVTKSRGSNLKCLGGLWATGQQLKKRYIAMPMCSTRIEVRSLLLLSGSQGLNSEHQVSCPVSHLVSLSGFYFFNLRYFVTMKKSWLTCHQPKGQLSSSMFIPESFFMFFLVLSP